MKQEEEKKEPRPAAERAFSVGGSPEGGVIGLPYGNQIRTHTGVLS